MSNLILKKPLGTTSSQGLPEHIRTLLAQIIQERQGQIQAYVFDQLSDRDGAPQIGQLKISHYNYDENLNNGKFRLNFQINRHFCCSDDSSCQQDYMDFILSIDQKELILEGHFFQWDLQN